MKTEQQLLDMRRELLSRLNELTREEMRELVELEMKLADKGYDIESHEELWLSM